jgi:hypothetical protein
LSNFFAYFPISSALKSIFSNLFIALFKLSTLCSSKNIPVFQSITDSNAHHLPKAITGVPEIIASTGTSQKSSSGGNKNAFAFEKSSFVSFDEIFNFQVIFSFDFFFKFLNNLFGVFVTKITFFQFSLKASTTKSNFLYGIHLQTYK